VELRHQFLRTVQQRVGQVPTCLPCLYHTHQVALNVD
jgi:hypothetical protein